MYRFLKGAPIRAPHSPERGAAPYSRGAECVQLRRTFADAAIARRREQRARVTKSGPDVVVPGLAKELTA